ncbi:hypothetical protein D9M73_115350 [compost metagenome]
MAVRIGGDAHHQMRALAGIPFHAVAHLQHGDAVVPDEPFILAESMRDGDAFAQVGVGDRFAPHHAVFIAGADTAGTD